MNPITDHLDIWSSVYVKKATTGRGSNGKVSPYGIKKLRELILELAVRGKLVPQDPDDEPASVLLEKIAEEKVYLIKEKVMRKTKVPAPFDEQAEYDLPRSWSWTTLYEMGEIGPRNIIDDQLDAAFVPMQHISEKYGIPIEYELRSWKEIKKGFTHFQDNDVVLAKITPCFQNGKSTVMRGLKNGLGAGTTELHVFRPIKGTVVPEFVLIYLKSPGFILEGIPKMTGTAGQKRITRDYFAGKHFPLPPLAEQHRIVAKVDELMALCDQLEQQQTDSLQAHQTLVETILAALVRPTARDDAQVPRKARMPGATGGSEDNAAAIFFEHFDTLFTTEASIDQLKQTILQLAVMGKLVPQNPNDEPASVLLEKIAEEKARLVKEKKIRKGKPVAELSQEERFRYLPKNWEEIRLAEFVTEVATGPFGSMVHKSDYIRGGVQLINPSHMIDGSIIPDSAISVSDEKAVELASHKLLAGDVVMARRGEMGRCAVVTNEFSGLLCGTGSFVLRFHKDVDRGYVFLLFRSEYVRSYLGGKSVGATMTNLNHGILNKMPIAVPPIHEQHRIVAKVDELMALCDTLKARLQDAQITQTHLADAIVEQAVA